MRRHFKDWFLSKGLTSITTIQDTAPNEFLALQELQREGGLPVRVRVYPVAPHAVALNDLIRVGWGSGFGNETFKFGGVKFSSTASAPTTWDAASQIRSGRERR